MSRKKKQNKLLRNKYQITGEELIKQGKLDPYFNLKDHIDMKEEQLKKVKSNLLEEMTFSCIPTKSG